MIRNYIFRYQSLGISYFWVKIKDSRHFHLAIYTVFHAESESAVRIYQFLHPEEKINKNQPMRVSISYRKHSYYMSPPYLKLVSIIMITAQLRNSDQRICPLVKPSPVEVISHWARICPSILTIDDLKPLNGLVNKLIRRKTYRS